MKLARILIVTSMLAPAMVSATGLDPSFGYYGRVLLDDRHRIPSDAILQQDGKIVVVGGTYEPGTLSQMFVARFDPNGTLDTTFDGDGIAMLNFPCTIYRDCDYIDRADAIAEQPDGKLVIAGSSTNSGTRAAVARLNPDGSLDTSFRGVGFATLPGADWGIAAIALQADGKVLLGGGTSVVRLLSDGSLDTSYGVQGTGFVNLSSDPSRYGRNYVYGVTLQPGGKLVATGENYQIYVEIDRRTMAARLNVDGTLDATFGSNGISVVPFTRIVWNEIASQVLVLPDQSLLLAGTHTRNGNDNGVPSQDPVAGLLHGTVLRLDTTGGLDTTFGVNGKARDVNGPSNDTVRGMALEANGNIVVAGAAWRAPITPEPTDRARNLALSRLTPAGALDTSFGEQGHLSVDFSAPGGTFSSEAVAVLAQPNGRLVAVGYRASPPYDTEGSHRLILAGICTPTIQFASTSTAVSESASTVNLTLRRSSCATATSVDYVVNAGTASAGQDFTAASGTLTWAINDPADKTLAIPLLDDTSDEPNEQFTVVLSGSRAAAVDTTSTVTITDDDELAPPPPNNSGGGGGGSLGYSFLLGLLAIGLVRSMHPLPRGDMGRRLTACSSESPAPTPA
jgi:uncharacterized delta-60 repeat protein